MAWGTVAFAVGFLWSSLFGGEFTGTALCVITPVVYRVLITFAIDGEPSGAVPKYPALNYVSFMSGIPYIVSPVRVLIEKPLPWITF